MSTPATLAAYERIVAAPPQEGFELFALALRAAADQERARCVAVIEAEIYALLAESADRDNEARAGAIHQDIHLLDTLLAKVRQ